MNDHGESGTGRRGWFRGWGNIATPTPINGEEEKEKEEKEREKQPPREWLWFPHVAAVVEGNLRIALYYKSQMANL